MTSSFWINITRQRYGHLAHTEGILVCWTCASPIANHLHYETLRSEHEPTTPATAGRDLHGSHAKERIGNYVDDRTCSGKRRAAPFDKTRDSIDEQVVNITRQRYEHLAHTEGALVCWTCASPIAN